MLCISKTLLYFRTSNTNTMVETDWNNDLGEDQDDRELVDHDFEIEEETEDEKTK